MAQWQRRLDIKDVWSNRDIHKIADALHAGLRQMSPLGDERLDYEREDLAEQFADIAANPKAKTADFDYCMDALYDWADTPLDGAWNGKKVCWVATF